MDEFLHRELGWIHSAKFRESEQARSEIRGGLEADFQELSRALPFTGLEELHSIPIDLADS